MAGQAGHCLPVEQVGVVLQAAGQASGRLGQEQGQVKLGMLPADFLQVRRYARQDQVRPALVLQGQHHLEQRLAAQVTRRLQHVHQHIKGEILVAVRFHQGLAHPLQQLPKGGAAGQVGAQHQRIDKETDQRLHLDRAAVGHRRADPDIRLAGIAIEQDVENRQQAHEQGRPGLARQGLQRLHGGGRDVKAVHISPVGLDGGARPVGGQQHGLAFALVGPTQLVFPVGQVSAKGRAAQLLALPGGIIGILDGKPGQVGHGAGRLGCIKQAQLPHENPQRPVIPGDVVHHQQQHVHLVGQAPQGQAQQRPLSQVERRAGSFAHPPGQLGLGVGQWAQIGAGQGKALEGLDHLVGPAILGRIDRAQGGVPPEDLAQAVLQGRQAQLPLEAQRRRFVVQGRAGDELVQKPQALLGKGQRRWAGRLPRREQAEDRLCQPGRPGFFSLDQLRQPGYAPGLEQAAHRQVDRQRLPHTPQQLRGQQGMPAQLKEIVQHPHRLHPQQVGPDPGQLRLQGCARRQVGLGQVRASRPRAG